MSAILVLWDIDHTLIENHGVNKETYALAFKLLTGREGALRERGHELPGARDALAALQASAGIVQSLSGNIRPDAVTKLSAFGLEGFTDFEAGGYGSDDEVGANLVAAA